MRAKLKHELTDALFGYLRWSKSKRSPKMLLDSAVSSGAQHIGSGRGPMATLLHTLREVHSFCYVSAMKKKRTSGKKAKKKAAAIAAFTAGSDVNLSDLPTDKISVVDMPDLVQWIIPIALQQSQSLTITDADSKCGLLGVKESEVTLSAWNTIESELDMDAGRISLLVASLDAIAGIRQVPNAEIGVKGFLVGVKRVLHKQMQSQYAQEKRRGGDSEGSEAWPEVDFDSDMIYWGGDRVATSPEITLAFERLLTAIGGEFGREEQSSTQTSPKGGEAGGASSASAMDMIIAMSLRDDKGPVAAGVSDNKIDESALQRSASHAHATFQMVKTLAYALELLPVLKHVQVDPSHFRGAVERLLHHAQSLQSKVSVDIDADAGAGSKGVDAATAAEREVKHASKAVSAAGRLFMLRPHLFHEVDTHVRPLMDSMLAVGLFERATDCLQVYMREVIMPTPSIEKGADAGAEVNRAKRRDSGNMRKKMNVLAEEVATRMSRADLVLRLFTIDPAAAYDENDEEGGGDGKDGDNNSASAGTHYDGRNGSNGNSDMGLVATTSQNALIACRQAHVIAGVYGLTELKSRVKEQLTWIKIVSFASKGKWQLAYQLCGGPGPGPGPGPGTGTGAGSSSAHGARPRSARSSTAAAHLFNYLKSRGMFSEAQMVWAQEQGFEHAVLVEVRSAPTAASEPVNDRDGWGRLGEEAYVPFVQGGEGRGTAGARGGSASGGVEPEVAVVAVSAEQLAAQRRLVQGTYLPFPFSSSGGDGRERQGGGYHIVMVDGLEALEEAEAHLFPASHTDCDPDGSLLFVGIDAEWKAVVPQYGGSAFQPAGASLLQVAVAPSYTGDQGQGQDRGYDNAYGKVFLFDLDALSAAAWQDSGNYSDRDEERGLLLEESSRVLQRLFSSRHVVKAGWDTNSGDLAMLRAAGNGAFKGCFDHVEAMLDVARVVSADYRDVSSGGGGGMKTLRPVLPLGAKRNLSLSEACKAFLGRPLHKSMQVSDWSARPLTPQQQQYAANDALVLLGIMDTVLDDYAALASSSTGGGLSAGISIPTSKGVRGQYMRCLRDSGGDGDDYAGREDALPPLIIEGNTREATALHQWLLSSSGGNWREAGWK